MLDHSNRLAVLVRDEIAEGHRGEVLVHLLVQRGPEVMRHAAPLVVAVLLAAALRRIERLVHRLDDLRHGNLARLAGKGVTPPPAPPAPPRGLGGPPVPQPPPRGKKGKFAPPRC